MQKIILPFFLFLSLNIFGQNIHLNSELIYQNEKSISSNNKFHFTIKPYIPKDFKNFKKPSIIPVKSKLLNKLFNYDLIKIEKNKSFLKINPIFHSLINYNQTTSSILLDNRIGLSLNSNVKNKLFLTSNFFYSNVDLSDSQTNFADSFGIIPHFGKFLNNNRNNYSYVSFSGELTYQANENIYFHLGNGKHFFGNGYRSLFLSDNSNSYPYIKATIDIWKIKYIWLVAKLNDFELFNGKQSFNFFKKATFTHYFSLNISKRINFNFFETIITNPYDIRGNKKGYEAAYFNPLIFYRPVEFYSGTADNSLMGFGLNLRLFKSLHLYSQFILDDLIISELKKSSGWWGNKFGLQAGLKAYNFLNIYGLFFRAELNIIRPYTYSHGTTVSKNAISNINYGNYHQNLAHPTGANFAEAISIIRYNKKRFSIRAKMVFAKKGYDNDSISYGGNIYNSYNLRPNNYKTSILQGEKTNMSYIDFNFSYIVNPNYNLRIELGTYKKLISNKIYKKNNTIIYFGITSRIFNETTDFF